MTKQTESSGKKYAALQKSLLMLDKVAVAFSGGVDSTFLLKAVKESGIPLLAVSVRTPYIPEFEMMEAADFCRKEGIPHRILEMPIPESVQHNPPNRCYLCKHELFTKIFKTAEKENFHVLLDGSNADDRPEERPGMRALSELQVISPLKEVGLDKDEIRALAREKGLPIWDKPAYSCLMTRLPHDVEVREEDLRRIEKAEGFLHSKGYRQVRVRLHQSRARIEIPPEHIAELAGPEVRKEIIEHFVSLGFTGVSLDLSGYQAGNMRKT